MGAQQIRETMTMDTALRKTDRVWQRRTPLLKIRTHYGKATPHRMALERWLNSTAFKKVQKQCSRKSDDNVRSGASFHDRRDTFRQILRIFIKIVFIINALQWVITSSKLMIQNMRYIFIFSEFNLFHLRGVHKSRTWVGH